MELLLQNLSHWCSTLFSRFSAYSKWTKRNAICIYTLLILKNNNSFLPQFPLHFHLSALPAVSAAHLHPPLGLTVPGDIGFNPGEGNAPNLNAGIGGGPSGAKREKEVGHGLCGDKGDRRAFMVSV